MFVGTHILIKVCCDFYFLHYCYACHWSILSYTNLFIYWMLLWVITSLYPWKVCAISSRRFKGFRAFWPCTFTSLLVKGRDNFWKVWEIINGFNKSCRHIDSGVEKLNVIQWVLYIFLPSLKEIYHYTPIFLGNQSHRECREIM